MQSMAAAVRSKIHDRLDFVTHALMAVFVNDPDAGTEIEQRAGDFRTLAKAIIENMSQAETPLREELFATSPKIMTKIDSVTAARIAKLRASSRFTAATAEGLAQNKCLATDFLPVDAASPDRTRLLTKAQALTNEEAELDGERVALDQWGNQWDNDLEASCILTAIAQPRGNLVPKPGQLSPEEQADVDDMAQKMSLRPSTALMMHAGFTLAMHKQAMKQKEGPLASLDNALFCAEMISSVREEQFFNHFSTAHCKQSEGTVGGPNCHAMILVKEIQNEEMDNLRIKAAASLTKMLNWSTISRQSNLFATATVPESIVTIAIDKELNPVETDSAAYRLIMKAYDTLYDKFDDTYKASPTQAFADLGVVTQEQLDREDLEYWKEQHSDQFDADGSIKDGNKVRSELYDVLSGCVAFQANFDGSTGAVNLLKAVKSVCIFEEQVAGGDDQAGFSYLWFDALKSMLTALGWTESEMKEDWLQARWTELTEGLGLFRYQGLEELNAFVMGLAEGGMWRAGIKALMLEIQVGGYLGCDVERDGSEKAADVAVQVEWMDKRDLKAIRTLLIWPEFVEKAYQNHGISSGEDGPVFMPVSNVIDFLMECIYDELQHDADKSTLAPMSLYSADVFDLQWRTAVPKDGSASDGTVWHLLPNGTERHLRGLWLEVTIDLFMSMDCVAHSYRLFYQGIQYAHNQAGDTPKPAFLRIAMVDAWLRNEYLKEKHWVTASEWQKLLNMLKLDIALEQAEHIFTACPCKPDDDTGDLRCITDLATGTYIWMGYGIWKNAIVGIVEHFLPRGPMRSLALAMLPEEFAKLDKAGCGILQPAETIALIHRLVNPGLTCEDLGIFLSENLQIQVPQREIHKYFTMMDVDGNGVLDANEFIPMIRQLFLGFFPDHVMRALNLGPSQIARFVITIAAVLLMVFALVTLVIGTFAAGRDVISVIHTGVTGVTGIISQNLANGQLGFEGSMFALIAALEGWVTAAIVTALGLSTAAIDRFAQVEKEFQKGVSSGFSSAPADAPADAPAAS